jgi:hypothetical protein
MLLLDCAARRHELHELAAPKSSHVFRFEREPLTVGTLELETTMPVGLDAYRVVGVDRVHDSGSLRELE